ncbi:hypothetical protein BKA62DRAFT_721195 [Auriculariales sp. MPI-PUGE-AT-0066]|nr:hypothetical protein BKA62DRAFT_721195 [Auriculariales sp. MPI-PUGE-AT-0066]
MHVQSGTHGATPFDMSASTPPILQAKRRPSLPMRIVSLVRSASPSTPTSPTRSAFAITTPPASPACSTYSISSCSTPPRRLAKSLHPFVRYASHQRLSTAPSLQHLAPTQTAPDQEQLARISLDDFGCPRAGPGRPRRSRTSAVSVDLSMATGHLRSSTATSLSEILLAAAEVGESSQTAPVMSIDPAARRISAPQPISASATPAISQPTPVYPMSTEERKAAIRNFFNLIDVEIQMEHETGIAVRDARARAYADPHDILHDVSPAYLALCHAGASVSRGRRSTSPRAVRAAVAVDA